jgi:CRP/FNR family transcriptional regulator, cyclic AMP receptor protein
MADQPTTRFPDSFDPEDLRRASTRGFLSALTGLQRDRLIHHGRRQRYRAGAILFAEGDRSERVLLLISGKVKISSYTEDGNEVVLAIRVSGDLLGEVAAIDGKPHSATVGALEPLETLVMGTDDFRAFLTETPGAAVAMLEMEIGRLRDADRKRIEFGAFDSVGRVASRLLELAERFGEPDDDGIRITLPLSQQELAGWVGCSREAVSKALSSLRQRRLIETRRRAVTVLDLPGLRLRAT